MHDYNVPARIYWWTIAAIGYALLAHAVYSMLGLTLESILQVAMALVLVGAVAFFPVTIPRTKISVAGGEIFIVLALLLFGVEAAIVAASLEGAIGAARTSRRWTSWFGTPAMAAITVFASGHAFVAARAALESASKASGAEMMLLLTLLALVYWAIGNLLPSFLLAIKRSERLDVVKLLKDRSWMAVADLCSAAIAGLLYFAGAEFGVWVAIAASPTIVLSLSSAYFLFERAEVQRRAQADLLDAANQTAQRAEAHAAELARSQARFHGAFNNAAIGIALVSSTGAIRQANPAVCKMLGYTESELLARSLGDLMPAGDYSQLEADIVKVAEGANEVVQREFMCIDKQGERIGVAFSVADFGDEAVDSDLIVQMQDIRERKQAQDQLLKLAFHDVLTGLPNRAYFREQLAKALARSKRDGNSRFAMMFLDFDRFKAINDSLGHGAGDELLNGFARRIQGLLRATDTVARLGGDEFAFLVEGFAGEATVIELAIRILDTFKSPFLIEGTNITSSASIGIAFGNANYASPDEVIRDADLAMYKAKTQGKAQYAIFDSALHDRATAELQTENELRRALERGELRVHYQPKYRLADRTLFGYETLVRWAHPKRGLLYPESFLPIAEETGLIIPVGMFVIEQALQQMKRWRLNPQGQDLCIAINVSSRELNQELFFARLMERLEINGIPANLVNIELGEGALIEGHNASNRGLERLRAAGISINVNNFGTGFSSLSHLVNMPIDGINIDRAFVQQADDSLAAKEVIRAINSLGRALGKRVCAKGIETDAQWRIMQDLGCDIGQGNLFSPPIGADEINLLISSTRFIRAHQ